jgi:error-prone DNA polymerase
MDSRLMMVEGKLQIEGEVIHVIASSCYEVSKVLRKLNSKKLNSRYQILAFGDEYTTYNQDGYMYD